MHGHLLMTALTKHSFSKAKGFGTWTTINAISLHVIMLDSRVRQSLRKSASSLPRQIWPEAGNAALIAIEH